MTPEPDLNLISVNCCICNTNSATPVGKGRDFEYHTSSCTFTAVRCNTCGLIYLSPRPDVSEVDKIYPSTYHAYNFSRKNFGFIHYVRSRFEAWRLLRVFRHLPNDAKILDVGCGDGFHLDLLRRFGKKEWKLEGIDINRNAAEAAIRMGLEVHLGRVEEIDLPNEYYDSALLIMAIEHVEDPYSVLMTIHKLLKKGGRLVIVTDNTDSLDFKFFKTSHWGGYHFPRHFNLFNSRSIEELAKKTGFGLEQLKTITSPVNWVYSIHNTLVDKKSPKWLVNCFTLRSVVSLTIFTALDFVLQKFGKGSIMRATLIKN